MSIMSVWFVLSDALKCIIATLIIVMCLAPLPLQPIGNNGSSGNTPHVYPWNLLCDVPHPNMNITDAQINEFWGLEASDRLSGRLTEAGRCLVAVKRLGNVVNPGVCVCVNGWWSMVVACGALVATYVYVVCLISRCTPGGIKQLDGSGCCGRTIGMVGAAAWFIMAAVATTNDLEFYHQPYGKLYPIPYFASPITWTMIGFLSCTNTVLAAIDCVMQVEDPKTVVVADIAKQNPEKEFKIKLPY